MAAGDGAAGDQPEAPPPSSTERRRSSLLDKLGLGKNVDPTVHADKRVDLAKTREAIKSWPKMYKGYVDLAFWLTFVALYCVVLTQQQKVGRAYIVDEALRSSVVDEGGSLQEVSSQGDFFDYLEGTIMENVFPAEWYNGDSYSQTETGYILDYNKLVGGLLIVQERGVQEPCSTPMYASVPSMYSEWYRDCYSSTPAQYDSRYTEADRKNGTVRWKSNEDTVLPANVNASISDPSVPSISDAFTYNDVYPGFAMFLAVADSTAVNLAKVQALRKFRWLDNYTQKVTIKFAVYNGLLELFTFVRIDFGYSRSGVFKNFNELGGTRVSIASMKMEPYRIGRGAPNDDLIQLVLEVIMTVLIFYQITNWLRNLFFPDKYPGDDETERESRLSIWLVIDIANYVCFVMFIIMRLQLTSMVLERYISVPTAEYQMVLEDAYVATQNQLLISFINILLCLLRCFKFYRFQPRLAVINETINKSMLAPISSTFQVFHLSDLYHFFLMFFTFLAGFGVMTNILFGPQLYYFSNLGSSIMTGVIMMLGGGLDRIAPMAYVNEGMGFTYFLVFMFGVNILLLNILLAILVEGYAAAKEELDEKYDATDDNSKIPTLASDIGVLVKRAFAFSACADAVLLQAVDRAIELYEEEECSLQDLYAVIPDKVKENNLLDMEKVWNHPSLTLVEEEDQDDEHPHIKKKAEAVKLSSEEEKLLSQIEALLDENEELHSRYMLRSEELKSRPIEKSKAA